MAGGEEKAGGEARRVGVLYTVVREFDFSFFSQELRGRDEKRASITHTHTQFILVCSFQVVLPEYTRWKMTRQRRSLPVIDAEVTPKCISPPSPPPLSLV